LNTYPLPFLLGWQLAAKCKSSLITNTSGSGDGEYKKYAGQICVVVREANVFKQVTARTNWAAAVAWLLAYRILGEGEIVMGVLFGFA
jgi:hypothetical protein